LVSKPAHAVAIALMLFAITSLGTTRALAMSSSLCLACAMPPLENAAHRVRHPAASTAAAGTRTPIWPNVANNRTAVGDVEILLSELLEPWYRSPIE
jgi:hypothetical protein